MARQEYIGLPGTYTLKMPGKKQEGLDFSRVIRDELRANGYPMLRGCDKVCEQPNLCDLLVDCEGFGAGAFTASNGVTLTGDNFELGGTLVQSTVITAPTTFDFDVVKDNVRLKIDNTGWAAFGNGESASFVADNGTISTRTGVYTDALGNPTMGSHANNTTTGIYEQFYLNPQIDTAFLKVGRTTPDEFMLAQFTVNKGEFGYQNNTVAAEVKLVVEKVVAPTVVTVIKLIGLNTYANDAAAAAALPTKSLWRDSTNNIKIVP